jgi:flagellar basal-body rod protein FlgB
VSEISDAALLTALRRQMTIAAARQVVAAGNLANVSTPGFRAREADFSAALDESLEKPLAVTHPRHMQTAHDSTGPRSREAEGLPARRDGNTVQIDRELLEMTRAAGEFQRAQTALSAKFRLVRYALSEGR